MPSWNQHPYFMIYVTSIFLALSHERPCAGDMMILFFITSENSLGRQTCVLITTQAFESWMLAFRMRRKQRRRKRREKEIHALSAEGCIDLRNSGLHAISATRGTVEGECRKLYRSEEI
jgi:hypothetical protein